jgi:hypothetical protein
MPSSDTRTRRIVCLLSVLAVGVVAACSVAATPRSRPVDLPVPRVALPAVLTAVRDAPKIRALPAGLTPAPATAAADIGFDNEKCEAGPAADRIEPCVFGDPASAFTVLLYGDSHAGMWLPALSEIAARRHWRLQFYGKPACPAPRLLFPGEPASCAGFRDFVLAEARADRPDAVIVTSASFARKVTSDQWRGGLARTLSALRRTGAQVVVLGDIPVLDGSAPECLAAHPADVPACATPRSAATERVWHTADRAAARATGSAYLPVLPWLCSAVCTPVIGNVTVYRNRFQLSATYARLLTTVLEDALLKAIPAAPQGDAAG